MRSPTLFSAAYSPQKAPFGVLKKERKKGGRDSKGETQLEPTLIKKGGDFKPKGWGGGGLGWAGLGKEKCKTPVEDMPGHFSFLQGLFFAFLLFFFFLI